MTRRSDSMQAGSSASTSQMYACPRPCTCSLVLFTVAQKASLTLWWMPSLDLYHTSDGMELMVASKYWLVSQESA